MSIFKPLLASSAPEDLSKLRFPVLASPKLDGIRCVKLNGEALSRNLKSIPNNFVRTWIERWLPDGIDGELLLRDHRRPFSDVTSAIMSKNGEPDFLFQAFDRLCGPTTGLFKMDETTAPFQERFGSLARWYNNGVASFAQYASNLRVVNHEMAHNVAELQAIVDQHALQGYEGTMVRDPAGRYKFGRSTTKEGILLKIKAFADDEATVVGVYEEMENTNEAKVDALGHTERSSSKAGKVGKGTLGGFHCRMADGTTFDLGGGFTAEQRTQFWKGEFIHEDSERMTGRLVKFKHQPPPGGRPATVPPRFPVFLGFRHQDDQ